MLKKHRESRDDLVDVARRYRSVVIALISTTGFYAIAVASGITGIGTLSLNLGPCGDPSGLFMIMIFAVIKLFAITSVVRLSDQLGDPAPIGIIQFLLVLPFLIDVPVLAFNMLRARSVLRSAGVNAHWYLVVKAAHRTSRNLCRKCGYNLTGNVSGICPECGTRIERAEPAKA